MPLNLRSKALVPDIWHAAEADALALPADALGEKSAAGAATPPRSREALGGESGAVRVIPEIHTRSVKCKGGRSKILTPKP